MASFKFVVNGTSKLLMHADDIERADMLSKFRKDPKNKGISKAGDDRSPAWTWQTYLYVDVETGRVVIPGRCMMACLTKAGTHLSGAKRGSLKKSVAAGVLINEEFLTFTVNGKPIDAKKILDPATRELDYDGQKALASKLGFELHAIRAKIGQSKHIRVRPSFSGWSISGTIETLLPEINSEVLDELFSVAGKRIGIGDWRPDSPGSPGPHGRFSAMVQEI